MQRFAFFIPGKISCLLRAIGSYGYLYVEGQPVKMLVTRAQAVKRVEELRELDQVSPRDADLILRMSDPAIDAADASDLQRFILSCKLPQHFDPGLIFHSCDSCDVGAVHSELLSVASGLSVSTRLMTLYDAIRWAVHHCVFHGLSENQAIWVIQQAAEARLPFDEDARNVQAAHHLHKEYKSPMHLTCKLR